MSEPAAEFSPKWLEQKRDDPGVSCWNDMVSLTVGDEGARGVGVTLCAIHEELTLIRRLLADLALAEARK